MAIDGDLSTTTSDSVVVSARPISAPAQTVSVTNAPGESVTLELRSGLPESAWAELAAREEYVESATCESADPCGTVTIVLQQGVTYDLRLAKVGVGPGAVEEPGAYLTKVGGRPTLARLGATDLTVEARDRFNTPESGATVTFAVEDGEGYFVNETGVSLGSTAELTTGENGQTTARFKPTGNESVSIVAESDLDGDGTVQADERVRFVDLAFTAGGGGGSGEINPNDEDQVRLVDAVTREIGQGNQRKWIVDVTFENRGETTSINASRVNVYIANSVARNTQVRPDAADISGTVHVVGGEYVTDYGEGFPVQLNATETRQYRFEFTRGGENFRAYEGDFFVFSIEFEDGTVGRYFIAPRNP